MNTIVPQLDLNVGYLSKAFLAKAGAAIQTELQTNYPKGSSEGNVVESSSGQLALSIGCKRIYHVVCGHYDPNKSPKVLLDHAILFKVCLFLFCAIIVADDDSL